MDWRVGFGYGGGAGRDFWLQVRKSERSTCVDDVLAMVYVGDLSVELVGALSSEGVVDGVVALKR